MSECKNWQNGRDRTDPEVRFWSKVNKNGPNGCWLWMACRNRGYGVMSVNKKATTTHRYSWELHNGPIPDGLHVCHHCDNPRCVNPDHLFLGTHQDNMQDMINKGRMSKGETKGSSKLTEPQVHVIRMYLDAGFPQKYFADGLGLCQQTISDIKLRRTWVHI